MHERFEQKEIDEKKELPEMSQGERMRVLRERAGLSQVDAAELLGVSIRTVSYYEIEASYPTFINLIPKYCQLYSVTADELLGLKPVPERDPRTVEGKMQKILYLIKELPAYKKRTLYQVIDTFLELNDLKKELGRSVEAPQNSRLIKKRKVNK